MSTETHGPGSSEHIDPQATLDALIGELEALEAPARHESMRHAVEEMETQVRRARRQLAATADDDAPRSDDIRLLRRLDLVFERIGDLLRSGNFASADRRHLEKAADLLRAVQGRSWCHLQKGSADGHHH